MDCAGAFSACTRASRTQAHPQTHTCARASESPSGGKAPNSRLCCYLLLLMMVAGDDVINIPNVASGFDIASNCLKHRQIVYSLVIHNGCGYITRFVHQMVHTCTIFFGFIWRRLDILKLCLTNHNFPPSLSSMCRVFVYYLSECFCFFFNVYSTSSHEQCTYTLHSF